jgi:hypothetical protein
MQNLALAFASLLRLRSGRAVRESQDASQAQFQRQAASAEGLSVTGASSQDSRGRLRASHR